MDPYEKYIIQQNNYTQVKQLKSGSHGRSYLFKSKVNKRKVVFKYGVMSNAADITKFQRDLYKIISCVHPSIAHFEGFIPLSNDFVCMIATSFLSSTLEDITSKLAHNEHIPQYGATQKVTLFLGVVAAVKFMHSLKIVHGNLKPSNILVDKNFKPLVTDYFLNYLGPHDSIYCFDEPQSFASDITSLGSIAYELFSGKQMPGKLQHNSKPPLPQQIPSFVCDIIHQCWRDNPELRPTASEIFDRMAYNLQEVHPDSDITSTRNYLSLILAFERERLMSVYGDKQCAQNFGKFLMETSSSISYQMLGQRFCDMAVDSSHGKSTDLQRRNSPDLSESHKTRSISNSGSEEHPSQDTVTTTGTNIPLVRRHSANLSDDKHGKGNETVRRNSADNVDKSKAKKKLTGKKSPTSKVDAQGQPPLPPARRTPRLKKKVAAKKQVVEKPKNFTDNPFDCAKNGDLQSLKYHISLDFNIESKNGSQQTLLHIAAKYGQLGIFQYLVTNQKMPIDLKADWGRSPLHYAAENGQLKIAQFIVAQNGGSVSEVSNDGRTPLHDAAGEGMLEVVNFLLECKGINVNKKDENGYTALHYAAESGKVSTVAALIAAKGIDINAKDGEGKTPLHYSAGEGRLEVLKILISSKDIDLNTKDKDGKTPLILAVIFDQVSVVQKLVSCKGIDLTIKDNEGSKALDYAKKSEIKKLLTKK